MLDLDYCVSAQFPSRISMPGNCLATAARIGRKISRVVNKAYKLLIPLLALWLVGWIILSWAAIQDDALIHLRYADNLLRTHHITFDGVHPNYGASSIFYVTLLAGLRSFIASPDLPHGVSSAGHLLLFATLALLCTKFISSRSSLARLLGLVLLFFISTPSAVRWLDDGMETSLGLCAVTFICWFTFLQSRRRKTTALQFIAFSALGFFAVMLRTEFVSLCGICFAILVFSRIASARSGISPQNQLQAVAASSHLLLGGMFALAAIFLRMHVLLPDTALAKSHGIAAWHDVVFVTPKILAGALSFGVGLPLFWTLTVILLVMMHRLSLELLLANSVFPVIFGLAIWRGQEVQGARYLAWTFFFSILWNILELALPPHESASQHVQPEDSSLSPNVAGMKLVYFFLIPVLLVQPVEAKLMYSVLTRRAATMEVFKAEHLENLSGELGVAFDVGYIGYFTHASICDLAGLVNGRDATRLTTNTRAAACALRRPGFIFGDLSQIRLMQNHMDLDTWQVCGRYDLVNLTEPNTHYLLLPPATAPLLCPITSGESPKPLSTLIALGSHL
jgi:hypothetical protein